MIFRVYALFRSFLQVLPTFHCTEQYSEQTETLFLVKLLIKSQSSLNHEKGTRFLVFKGTLLKGDGMEDHSLTRNTSQTEKQNAATELLVLPVCE